MESFKCLKYINNTSIDCRICLHVTKLRRWHPKAITNDIGMLLSWVDCCKLMIGIDLYFK